MGLATGAVGLISVDRSMTFVLMHGPTFSGATLWDQSQPLSAEELIRRTMWLSLVNKSLEQHLEIQIGFDDTTTLATSVMLTDKVVDISSSRLPQEAAKQAERFEQLIGARA